MSSVISLTWQELADHIENVILTKRPCDIMPTNHEGEWFIVDGDKVRLNVKDSTDFTEAVAFDLFKLKTGGNWTWKEFCAIGPRGSRIMRWSGMRDEFVALDRALRRKSVRVIKDQLRDSSDEYKKQIESIDVEMQQLQQKREELTEKMMKSLANGR